MNEIVLYLLCALLAALITAGSLPLLRRFLGRFFMDKPGGLKKHKGAVPVLGGVAVLLGFAASLVFIRLTTAFPSGTLHSLRGVLIGGGIIFALGIADDLHKPKGVPASVKLLVQGVAACILIYYGVVINIFNSPAVSYPLTFLWVIGVTNAFNLLDIQDGLCVSQAAVCALGLVIITLPSEYIYVNFAAMALLGACVGFWPYNHLRRFKTFLGDSGSTFLGFVIAALAIGTGYSDHSNLGFLAPLLILAVPLYDTLFVMLARILKRKNPLKGSNDHIALRLQKLGLSKDEILLGYTALGVFNNLLAFALTKSAPQCAAAIFAFTFVYFVSGAIFLLRVKTDP